MKIKIKATVYIEVDTDEYHIPADLNLRKQLTEDIEEAIEGNLSLTVTEVLINKVNKSNEEQYEDYN